jgi:hypothetical protein
MTAVSRLSAAPLTPPKAFALMIETACEDFEILQNLVRGRIKVSADGSTIAPMAVRAPVRIMMALAKSFVFNVRRANRICDSHKAIIAVERLERIRFLKATDRVTTIRDVNEHGFDGGLVDVSPMEHFHSDGGWIDETGMVVIAPERILIGPLNLYEVYLSVDRMRKLAGFSAVIGEKNKTFSPLAQSPCEE